LVGLEDTPMRLRMNRLVFEEIKYDKEGLDPNLRAAKIMGTEFRICL
tara:strand:+ start:304 stop:444 length:141 start_codon:yes stop_codon:yes gene_type:complete